MDFFNWLMFALGGATVIFSFAALGYLLGGLPGVYLVSVVLVTGSASQSFRLAGDRRPGAALLQGLLLPLLLMVPGLLVRFGIAKRNLGFLTSVAVGLGFWLIAAILASYFQASDFYPAILGFMAFASCYSGLVAPRKRTSNATPAG